MASPNPDAEPDDLPDADVDARWSDIVARLGDVEQSGWTVEHVQGSADDGEAGAASSSEQPAPTEPSAPVPRPAGPRDWPATPEVEALEEADDHFVPPDPEPVAHRDPLATLAWTVVASVPVLAVLWVILAAMLPDLAVPGWVGPAGGAAFVAAVAVLVWRMPHRRDPEDSDPGAVV